MLPRAEHYSDSRRFSSHRLSNPEFDRKFPESTRITLTTPRTPVWRPPKRAPTVGPRRRPGASQARLLGAPDSAANGRLARSALTAGPPVGGGAKISGKDRLGAPPGEIGTAGERGAVDRRGACPPSSKQRPENHRPEHGAPQHAAHRAPRRSQGVAQLQACGLVASELRRHFIAPPQAQRTMLASSPLHAVQSVRLHAEESHDSVCSKS